MLGSLGIFSSRVCPAAETACEWILCFLQWYSAIFVIEHEIAYWDRVVWICICNQYVMGARDESAHLLGASADMLEV